MAALAPLTDNLTGPVRLDHPEVTLRVILVRGAGDGGALPAAERRVVLGRELGPGRRPAKDALAGMSLRERPYIGPTSMDPEGKREWG